MSQRIMGKSKKEQIHMVKELYIDPFRLSNQWSVDGMWLQKGQCTRRGILW